MAEIIFACPSCNQSLEGSDELVGRTVECPGCKTQFVVPNTELADLTTTVPRSDDQQAQMLDVDVVHAEAATPTVSDDASPFAETVPTDASPTSTDTLGGNLGEAARAAGAEVQRGGRLVAIRAQIEKARRVDLKRAYHALGEAAFNKRVQPERFGQEYKDITDIDDRILEKTAADTTDTMATITAKAKGMVASAKRHAEAEVLKFGRNGKFEPLGRKILDAGDHAPELSTQIADIGAIESRILQLEKEADRYSADGDARASLRTSGTAFVKRLTSGVRPSHTPSAHPSATGQAPLFDWRRLLPLAVYTLGLGWALSKAFSWVMPERIYSHAPLIPIVLLAAPSLALAFLTITYYIRPKSLPLLPLIGSMLFTMLLGLLLLMQFQAIASSPHIDDLMRTAAKAHRPVIFVYALVAKSIGWSYELIASDSVGARFVGFIAGVGLCEEFTKLLPLFLLLFVPRLTGPSPLTFRPFLMVGFFSGIGFGVGEALSSNYAPWGGNPWVGGNIVRWFACVPSHAVYATIDAAILWRLAPRIRAATSIHRKLVLCAATTLLVAVIHGIYNTVCPLPFMGIIMDGISLIALSAVVGYVAAWNDAAEPQDERVEGSRFLVWANRVQANPRKFVRVYAVSVGLILLSLVWSSKFHVPTPNELYWGIPGATSIPVGQWACGSCEGTGKVGRKDCSDCNGRGTTSKPPPGTDVWDPYASWKKSASTPPSATADVGESTADNPAAEVTPLTPSDSFTRLKGKVVAVQGEVWTCDIVHDAPGEMGSTYHRVIFKGKRGKPTDSITCRILYTEDSGLVSLLPSVCNGAKVRVTGTVVDDHATGKPAIHVRRSEALLILEPCSQQGSRPVPNLGWGEDEKSNGRSWGEQD